MKQWMNRLAAHQHKMRQTHPGDDLAVVFDIDDTILDLRHMILHVLETYDHRHHTAHFENLTLEDIIVSEEGVDEIIGKLRISQREALQVMEWFKEHSWSSFVVREAHRPFPGVMEVLRWLQGQPRTFVALNTGRPDEIRAETLQCLHKIGQPCGVRFTDGLLFMSPYGWGERITQSKTEGIRYFRESGYRVTAFVDNEPENLRAVAELDRSGEILLLHADTVFSGKREMIPENAISGNTYDVKDLLHTIGTADKLDKAA